MSKLNVPDTIRVYVSKADVENGIKGIPSACPLALALKRKFNNKRICVSSVVQICSRSLKTVKYYSMSDRSVALIKKYDKTGKFPNTHITLRAKSE